MVDRQEVSSRETLEEGFRIEHLRGQDHGEEQHSGFSVTYPLNIYPIRYLGLRFVPTWSWIAGNTISDYDLAASFVYRYCSLRVGYRWLRAGGEMIDGPYFGVSVYY